MGLYPERLLDHFKNPRHAGVLIPPAVVVQAVCLAVMIALAGYFHAIKKDFSDPATLRADGNLRLARL